MRQQVATLENLVGVLNLTIKFLTEENGSLQEPPMANTGDIQEPSLFEVWFCCSTRLSATEVTSFFPKENIDQTAFLSLSSLS